jgi:hypothetical protein
MESGSRARSGTVKIVMDPAPEPGGLKHADTTDLDPDHCPKALRHLGL